MHFLIRKALSNCWFSLFSNFYDWFFRMLEAVFFKRKFRGVALCSSMNGYLFMKFIFWIIFQFNPFVYKNAFKRFLLVFSSSEGFLFYFSMFD